MQLFWGVSIKVVQKRTVVTLDRVMGRLGSTIGQDWTTWSDPTDMPLHLKFLKTLLDLTERGLNTQCTLFSCAPTWY